jgi:hypothetical protein
MQNFDEGKYLGALDEHTALGEQNYKGLLLSIQRRLTDGVSLNANYTISKCRGHATQGGGVPNINSGYVNPDNIDYDYGACAQDRRHIVNVTASVLVPEFENRAARVLASNWRVSGIFRASSGDPLTVTVTGDPAGTGVGGQRANVILDDVYGDKTVDNYLNAAAFSRPANGTYGDQVRGSFTGPGDKIVDLAVVRGFRFGVHRIEARIEAFNAFNFFRMGNPGTNLNAPATFGRITNAGTPRVMQFAVKYEF